MKKPSLRPCLQSVNDFQIVTSMRFSVLITLSQRFRFPRPGGRQPHSSQFTTDGQEARYVSGGLTPRQPCHNSEAGDARRFYHHSGHQPTVSRLTHHKDKSQCQQDSNCQILFHTHIFYLVKQSSSFRMLRCQRDTISKPSSSPASGQGPSAG